MSYTIKGSCSGRRQVDVDDRERAVAVHLHGRLGGSPRVVAHAGRHRHEAAGCETLAPFHVELVIHARVKAAGDDRDVFGRRMMMCRKLIVRWHFEADDIRAFLERIARKYGNHRAIREARRHRPPFYSIRPGDEAHRGTFGPRGERDGE
jgi:hypothetical protein